jgi:DNA (cytosine-5)-methyltransferase 1
MKRKKKTIKLKYGELFSGPGGLALGAINAKTENDDSSYEIDHAWASDYDTDSCKTYRANIAGNHSNSVFCSDINNLDLKSLGPIDIFAYGFPCNDFSVVGKRKGFNGNFGPLYQFGVKVLNLYKPKFFIAENVGGLASANEGEAFKKIIDDLSRSGNGYNITAHKYHSEDYGVPQTRHRIVIVGFDKQLGLQFEVPAPTHENNPVSAREALEMPPIQHDAFNHEFKKQSALVTERLRQIPPGENVWTAKLPKHLQLNVKSARLSQIYKRLDPQRPSYTITGSGGGGTHGYHYADPRPLTNRERARIQTFPDHFKFEGSIESVRKQIGMAVPPLLSQIIFTSALKTLAEIEYDSIEPNIILERNLTLV